MTSAIAAAAWPLLQAQFEAERVRVTVVDLAGCASKATLCDTLSVALGAPPGIANNWDGVVDLLRSHLLAGDVAVALTGLDRMPKPLAGELAALSDELASDDARLQRRLLRIDVSLPPQ
jgi:hypothetical protein